MANRLANPNTFAGTSPNWSLALLDANATGAQGAINDSSLGYVNGPLTDSGTANAYSVTCSYGVPSAYNNGMTVFFNPANTNTGASTLTVSPLGSLAIVRADGTACTGGEILSSQTTQVVCDGTAFRIAGAAGIPAITAVRLRGYNTIGNCNFEVDQRNVGNAFAVTPAAGGGWACDRWWNWCVGTLRYNSQQQAANNVVPGTNFLISSKMVRLTMTTAQASLGATDVMALGQSIEGSCLRQIFNDAHSVSILCRSSVANLKFGLALTDGGATPTRSLTKLCSLGAANTLTLIQLPNLPVFPVAGTFPLTPGIIGYNIQITLAAGATYTAPANDTWQTGVYYGAVGQSNFAANAGATFDMVYIMHEPGGQCTTLMDVPFSQNYDSCLRYYSKSWPYATAVGTTGGAYGIWTGVKGIGSGVYSRGCVPFPKRMAKTPTVTIYDPTTGSGGNSVYWENAGSTGSTSLSTVQADEAAITGMVPGGSAAGTVILLGCWTADTGW